MAFLYSYDYNNPIYSDPGNVGKTPDQIKALDAGFAYTGDPTGQTYGGPGRGFGYAAPAPPPQAAPAPQTPSNPYHWGPNANTAEHPTPVDVNPAPSVAAAPSAPAPIAAPTTTPMEGPTSSPAPLSGSVPSAASTAPLQAMSAGGGSATSEGFAAERSPELDTGLSQRQMPASSYALSRLASSRGGRVY